MVLHVAGFKLRLVDSLVLLHSLLVVAKPTVASFYNENIWPVGAELRDWVFNNS